MVLNSVAKKLWDEEQKNSNTDPRVHLWRHNCIIYATVAAWLLRTGKAKKNGSPRENQQRPMIPIWLKKIEMEVVKTRKEISMATAEIHRLQSNGKLTRKGKKN